eukprot:TRINITY_DN5375_c0_g2_i2.p1 TRINITY_DN5375_c0_g2~~TRINITY_DN5375_c0_g2_i2.p1  ORF type:complete len:257 (+),score=0.26 TRINITY_DN5375_c0_g2_i2:60-773(+)
MEVRKEVKETGEDPFLTDALLKQSFTQGNQVSVSPRIINVISSTNLGCEIDLIKIALQVKNSQLCSDGKRVLVRVVEPTCIVQVWNHGKIVCAGCKSEQDARFATRLVAKIIKHVGYPVKYKDFKIGGVNAWCNLQFPVRLQPLAENLHQEYDPFLFPGIVMRVSQPHATVKIFSNGQICIYGCNSTEDVYVLWDRLYPQIKSFTQWDFQPVKPVCQNIKQVSTNVAEENKEHPQFK